jgi:putative endonuclease
MTGKRKDVTKIGHVFVKIRDVSSVGLECLLDRQEVTGSIPVRPTKITLVSMYYVYVLYSKANNKIYIGFSTDPEKRLQSHNDPRNKGWTKRYQPWEMVLTETFTKKGDALLREKQLKTSRGRAFIRSIITQVQ